MIHNAKDYSNYSGVPTDVSGLDYGIAQAVNPEARGAPPGCFLDQLEFFQSANLPVGWYLYEYTADENWFNRCMALLDAAVARGYRPVPLVLPDGTTGPAIWLDVEDTRPYDPASRQVSIESHINQLNAWCAAHGLPSVGIYTGKWYVDDYLAGMPRLGILAGGFLWDSFYIGKQSDVQARFVAYGGFDHRTILQYAGTQPDGTDLDEFDLTIQSQEGNVIIPDDYVTKFSLPDNYSQNALNGLIDNFEGVIRTVQAQAGTQETTDSTALVNALRSIRDTATNALPSSN